MAVIIPHILLAASRYVLEACGIGDWGVRLRVQGVSTINCVFHSCCECTQTLTVGEQELGSSAVWRGVRSLFFWYGTFFSCGEEGAEGGAF